MNLRIEYIENLDPIALDTFLLVEFNSKFTVAPTEYKNKLPSLIQKGNFCGVQFHPENVGQRGNNY